MVRICNPNAVGQENNLEQRVESEARSNTNNKSSTNEYGIPKSVTTKTYYNNGTILDATNPSTLLY